ncbi:MAG: penicillin-binding protein 2 [Actinomycetia bacterium]|nr:penicillin-binding protein 2 [Actinomycetes bacterium]MCP4958491.1 penicillin-binding protein 2 [Actinomycetes bacterium]
MNDEPTKAANTGIRLAFMGIVVIALFSALFGRIWFLQVLATEDFQVQAETNQVRLVTLPPTRGRVLDRNGEILADNVFTGVVRVETSQHTEEDTELVLHQLELLTGVPRADLVERLADDSEGFFAPRIVATGMSEDILEVISERALPGVTADWEAVRAYPQKSAAAHVVGYVGAQPADWLEDHPDDRYMPSDDIGRAGIEGLFEERLRGTAGIRKIEVDRENNVVREFGEQPPIDGEDIVLTIDLELQRAVEFFLQKGLTEAQGRSSADDPRYNYPAYAGSAVVLDVRNGDVLAMASFPTYDPNWLVGGITSSVYDATFNDPFIPGRLNNRAVQGLYSPGSVFKLITAMAATKYDAISAREWFYDPGYYTVPVQGGSTHYNAGNAVYEELDLAQAITESSDVYFYSAAYEVYALGGDDQWGIQEVARDFGFGSPTGVQLPYERSGRVPDGDIKKALFEAAPEIYLAADNAIIWVPGDTINMAIGQGFLTVTPLQLVNAYATFANGGTLFQPNIVDKALSRSPETSGEVVQNFDPRILRQTDLSGVPVDVIREGLDGVTKFRNTVFGPTEGTAFDAFYEVGWEHRSYGIAGKTGTAENDGVNKTLARDKEDTAVFVGYGPTQDPRYAVVVLMEEAGFGGTAAAPVAVNIFDALRRFEQTWEEPEDLPLEATTTDGPQCDEIPITVLRDPSIELRVPEGCPYGIPTPVVTGEPDTDEQSLGLLPESAGPDSSAASLGMAAAFGGVVVGGSRRRRCR